MEEPRIGVFVCHCGTNIGGVVDVPEVVEYAKNLPWVVHAERNLFTCATDGLKSIKNGIKEHKLNRVIVASCTPRTHASLFQATCEEVGLNKYLFTLVNIRDQCSWVHLHEPAKATEKAKDLIRMGVARARLLEPQKEEEIRIEQASLVIGGGVSGMNASLSLANQGFQVYLVEKEAELGGLVRKLNNIFPSGKDANETIQPLIEKVTTNPRINLFTNALLKSIDGFVGNFNVVISQNGKEIQAKVGTIIIATGAEEYQPKGLYGYGTYPNVMTVHEFENLCKAKKLPPIRSIAFIQCAGSRGQVVSYCSRVCCNASIRNAMNIVENYGGILGKIEEVPAEAPEALRRRRRRRREVEPPVPGVPRVEITIFNRGITTYGVEHELLYNKAREKGIRFIKYAPENPPKVSAEGEKLSISYYHETLKKEMKILVDMIVLATPLVAREEAKAMSQLLKVPLGQEGFFLEAHVKLRPVDFATDGVFVCGTAKGPADITESTFQALAAASRAGSLMAKGYVQAEAITSLVVEELCTGCKICERICPFGAIRKNKETRKAEVIPAACKGCGICGATCPERAIMMTHYTDAQLLAETEAALMEVG
jgi:heterodisulfide reductase subunit A